MRMRQINIQLSSFQMLAHAKHGRAGIEHNAQLRQHKAGRVPALGWMVATSAQQCELHDEKEPKRPMRVNSKRRVPRTLLEPKIDGDFFGQRTIMVTQCGRYVNR